MPDMGDRNSASNLTNTQIDAIVRDAIQWATIVEATGNATPKRMALSAATVQFGKEIKRLRARIEQLEAKNA